MSNDWPYSGSRWWKFDFHTHTPASLDTTAWQKANGTSDAVTPETWLKKFMEAEIDCVVVSDHNTGAWIDKLKDAYTGMKNNPDEAFRELTLFPGVELSVNGGFHLLAVFDVDTKTEKIDSLRGAVDYRGTAGDCDETTRKSPVEVVKAIIDAGGLPIPAHVDQKNGLLRLAEGCERKAALDANTLKQVLEQSGILAMEQIDRSISLPEVYKQSRCNWTSVLGSDCHSSQGNNIPGSRYTWIKMAKPCLEGLRLALIDGNDISVRRSDEANEFKPFARPDFFIESIEVHDARYMGRGNSQTLAFSPFMNALVGGRGTGKSTVIHALRLAFDRERELDSFNSNDSPRSDFDRFKRTADSRNDKNEGALRTDTSITVVVTRDNFRHRLTWKMGETIQVEDEIFPGAFKPSYSQTVNSDRFPLRILSQGQVAAMAGENSQALMNIIDQAAGTDEIKQRLREAEATWHALRARLREIDSRLATKGETERKLADIRRKLAAFNTSQYAEILKAYQQAGRQKHEVEAMLSQLDPISSDIENLLNQLYLDDWPENRFSPETDDDILQWKLKGQEMLDSLKKEILAATNNFSRKLEALQNDPLKAQWQSRINKTSTAYENLKSELEAKGVEDPKAHDQFFRERQALEAELNKYKVLEDDKQALEQQINEQFKRIEELRVKITETRRDFVQSKLEENKYVKIEVAPFGYDPKQTEDAFRELIGASDRRFEGDILSGDSKDNRTGLLADLYRDGITLDKLDKLKNDLLSNNPAVGGHFHNYLNKLNSESDFSDRLRCWFPEDDLRISYWRESEFVPIKQGSKGQKAAAILAFLLSFGKEPLILDQPEDDLDNSLIYELIVKQMRESKLCRQLIVVTHNSNIVVNGDAEMVFAFDFKNECFVSSKGSLQDAEVREKVCEIMEGGKEAFSRRWKRVGEKG
jgi:energy-coupling factor transporter ATP-binding protein EcfA2